MADGVTTTILIGLAISAATAGASYLLTPPPPDQEGPRRDDLARTTSAYGKFRTITYGTVPNAGNIIDSSIVYPVAHEEEVGGKGGKSSTLTTYTYQQDIALGLGEGELDAVAQIFANEELIYDVNGSVVKPDWLDFTFYPGSETQLPDPTLQSIHGADNTPAYLGEAYIVFRRFNLSAFGDRIPNFRVITMSDAESEATETEVICNPDFSTETDAILTSAAMHPNTGYMVHGWQWSALPNGGRKNPIGTVTDPYSNQFLFALNATAEFDQLSLVNPSFGTIPKYTYGVQINGDYENILLTSPVNDGTLFFAYSAYSDVLEESGKLNLRFQEESWDAEGSVYADQFVIYGYYQYDPGPGDQYDLVYWNITLPGDVDSLTAITDLSSVVPGFAASNLRANARQRGGDLLIGSEYNVAYNIIKYTHLEAVKWVIQVPIEMGTPAQGAVVIDRCVYDRTTDSWWSAFNGKIWNFSNANGATIGAVVDISGDPNYVGMYTLPSFSDDTHKLYWVSHNAVPGDVAGSYDTITGEVLSYPVGSQESAGGLVTAWNTYYFEPTNALFYSSAGATRDQPSRRFRLQSLIGNAIPLSTIVDDIYSRCGIPLVNYNNTELVAVPVDGYAITNLTTGRSNTAPLQHGYLFDVVDSGGILKAVRKGNASVAALTLDDLGATTDIDNAPVAITVNRVMESQLPAIANIGYMNPDANYEHGSQQSTRGASSNTNVLNLELPIVFKDTPAKRLIDVILHQLHVERENYELSIMPEWIWLEGGDVIDVATEMVTQQMQLVRTSYVNGIMECAAVRVENSIWTSYLEGESAPPKNDVVAFPGIMLTGLLDIPLLRDTDDNAGFYAAATSYTDPWAGGVLFKSPDNTAWNVGSTFTSASIYGTTNDALPDPVDPWQWDNLNTIIVQVISGELDSVSEEQALEGFNSIAYGRDGRWEIINYVNADEVSPGIYELTKLIRGRLGSDHNVNNHQANDLFIPLKVSNLEYVGNELADLNVIRYYRGASFGVNLYTPSNITTPFVNHGVCITPLSPQQIDGSRNAGLDLTITWMPRSRYPASDFWSGVASEPDDLYDIEIYLDGETVPIHTITDNVGRSYVWLRADQISEADGTPQVVDISVWHKSQRLLSIGETGRGYEGTGRAAIGVQGPVPYYSAVGFLASTIVHFKVNETPITDGLPAAEETGSIIDAFYNVVGSISSTASVFPSNMQSDPNDKSFHCEENNFGDRLDIPITSNNVFNVGNKFSVSLGARVRGVKTSNNFVTRVGQFVIGVIDATDQIRFSVNGPEGVQYTDTDAAIDIRNDTNHHWVFTADISSEHNILEIYQDGALVSIGNQGTTITSVDQPTATTCYIAPELIWLDDFAYHDDVLSASAIAYLYSNTGL